MIVADIDVAKLDVVAGFDDRVTVVDSATGSIADVAAASTDGWGAEAVFEASGSATAAGGVFGPLCPGGSVVFVGMPPAPIAYDVAAGQVKEAVVQHVFRYANVYPRAIQMLASGAVEVADLITHRFSLADSAKAFDAMRDPAARVIKAQIILDA